MYKILFLLFSVVFISCAGKNKKSTEPIVKDSTGVTTGTPITNQTDSMASDTASDFSDVKTIVENYTGVKGEKIKATYQYNNKLKIVVLEDATPKPVKLIQKEAWSNGAEYTNGNIVWKVEGAKASLKKDGQTTFFTLIK